MIGVTILGNNSALAAHGRHPTAQVVSVDDNHLLLDCGEGAQMRCMEFGVKRSKINHIFISHLHGDHYFGLIGWLTSLSLLQRTQDLHVFAPEPLEEIINAHLSASNTIFSYKLIFHPLKSEGLILNEKQFTVSCFKTIHKINCFGFLVKENHKPRRLIYENAVAAGIPKIFFERLQSGEDYISPTGTLVKNESVTTEGKENSSYAFCADTLYTEQFLPFIQNADLLYHEATYLSNFAEQAKERFHSTAAQAATLAQKAGVKKLLLGHFSSKYDDLSGFALEAQPIFPHTEVSKEGEIYYV
jgi:ribonuclease Z